MRIKSDKLLHVAMDQFLTSEGQQIVAQICPFRNQFPSGMECNKILHYNSHAANYFKMNFISHKFVTVVQCCEENERVGFVAITMHKPLLRPDKVCLDGGV